MSSDANGGHPATILLRLPPVSRVRYALQFLTRGHTFC